MRFFFIGLEQTNL